MSILDLLSHFRKKKSASVAANRLHIIIAQESSQKNAPDYLPVLKQEILKLVAKYTKAEMGDVNIELHCKDHNAILELNVVLPEEALTS